MVLRLQLISACWSWSLPSSEEEALRILHHYMNMCGYVSNMDENILIKLESNRSGEKHLRVEEQLILVGKAA